MALEHLVENGGFGMSQAISVRRITDPNALIRRGEMAVLGAKEEFVAHKICITGEAGHGAIWDWADRLN